jgi:hypothetical protein
LDKNLSKQQDERNQWGQEGIRMMSDALFYRYIIIAMIAAFVLVGCRPGETTPIVTLPPEIVHTVAAQTVVAELTEQAALFTDTPTIEPPPTGTPSPTPIPTNTPAPSPMLTPTVDITATATTEPTPSPEPTSSPQPTLSPLPVRDLILEDDFEQTEAWMAVDGEQFSFSYQSGGYRVHNGFINGAVSSIRSIEYRHILVEVDAEQIAGPEDAYYGVVCRWQDTSNYYGLVVGRDNFYSIIRVSDGEIDFLANAGSPSEDSFRRTGSNRIGGSCLGDRLILFVNGERTLEVRDQTFESGYVGVVVGTRSTGGAEVHFDNFALLRP